MRRPAALLILVVLAWSVAVPAAAATAVPAKHQLRGHLPELGSAPALRLFQTQAAYDSFRNGLGDANVFPPASSMFMSFDRDILALYSRGNDIGGRCFATATGASLEGNTVTLDLSWQSGTCGAPITAHYPFILLSLSRTASDGSSWVTPGRSVCGSAPGVAGSIVCTPLSGAASPSPTSAPTASPAPTAAPSATPAPTPTRTLTPSLPATTPPVAAASPTAAAITSPPATRSPVAAASPQAVGGDTGANYLLYGMLIAIGFLVGIALMLSRGSGGSRRVR